MSVFNVPQFLKKFDLPFLKKFIIESAQSLGIAAGLGGLNYAAIQVPIIADHYGISSFVVAQLTAGILVARAFLSGLNSVKQTQ